MIVSQNDECLAKDSFPEGGVACMPVAFGFSKGGVACVHAAVGSSKGGVVSVCQFSKGGVTYVPVSVSKGVWPIYQSHSVAVREV